MSTKKCQKCLKFNKRLTFSELIFAILLSNLLSNEKTFLVTSLAVSEESVLAVSEVQSTIPRLLESGGDLITAESGLGVLGPHLDSVRGFVVRNNAWLTPLAAAVPAKMATIMTMRALRQQTIDQQIQRTLRQTYGLRGGSAWNRGRNCGYGGHDCYDGYDGKDEPPEDNKPVMLFLGKGNIQVKNNGHIDDDRDGTDKNHYSYQKIDLKTKLKDKEKPPANRLDREVQRQKSRRRHRRRRRGRPRRKSKHQQQPRVEYRRVRKQKSIQVSKPT